MSRAVYVLQSLLDDDEFDALSDDAQLAFFRVRLDARIGISGTGRIGWRALATHVRMQGSRLDAAVRELCAKWWMYDRETGVLWIRGAFAIEPKSPNIRRAVVSELARLPRGPIVTAWVERYLKHWEEGGAERERAALLELTTEARAGNGGPPPAKPGRRRTDNGHLEARAPVEAQAKAPAKGKRRSVPAGFARLVEPEPSRLDQSDDGRRAAQAAKAELLAKVDGHAGRNMDAQAVRPLVLALRCLGRYADTGKAVYQEGRPGQGAQLRGALARAFGEPFAAEVVIFEAPPEGSPGTGDPEKARSSGASVEQRLQRFLEDLPG